MKKALRRLHTSKGFLLVCAAHALTVESSETTHVVSAVTAVGFHAELGNLVCDIPLYTHDCIGIVIFQQGSVIHQL